jgi:uncharacterized protein YegL
MNIKHDNNVSMNKINKDLTKFDKVQHYIEVRKAIKEFDDAIESIKTKDGYKGKIGDDKKWYRRYLFMIQKGDDVDKIRKDVINSFNLEKRNISICDYLNKLKNEPVIINDPSDTIPSVHSKE